jgi:sulfane dehydrogenase subunit SoxC
MYKYEGKPLLLQSRSYDDSNNVQPTVNQEKAVVGVEGVYHRNAIITWSVSDMGEVSNVQVRS